MNTMAPSRPTELRWCSVQRITVTAAAPDEACRQVWSAFCAWDSHALPGCREIGRQRTESHCRQARGWQDRRG